MQIVDYIDAARSALREATKTARGDNYITAEIDAVDGQLLALIGLLEELASNEGGKGRGGPVC